MALPLNYRSPPVPPPLFGRKPPNIGVSSSKSASSGSTNYNPFIITSHGHPAFAAARFARLAETTLTDPSGAMRAMKPPKQPILPYMRYSKKMWDHVKAANPRIKSIPEISKLISKMWQELSDEERKEYELEFEQDKAQYQEALKQYHNSTAYQDWLRREQTRQMQLAQEAEEKKNMSSRVGMQQEDDDDNIFSLKHLAAARYTRNHCLMAEIFSDVVVPDCRQLVSDTKLTMMQNQVETLEKALEQRKKDISTMVEKHASTKKKISTDKDRWETQWSELCSKKPRLPAPGEIIPPETRGAQLVSNNPAVTIVTSPTMPAPITNNDQPPAQDDEAK